MFPARTEPFALSQFTTGGQTFLDDLMLCRQLDIPALEVCESKLPDNPHEAEDCLKALRDSGLTVCSVQARVHAVFPDQMAPEPRDPRARSDALRRTMDRFTEALPEQTPDYVLIAGNPPGHDIGAAREILLEEAIRLTDDAAARRARVAFEPLHPVMMNVDSFVWTWSEAVSFARALDRADSFGLVCDVWNLYDEPAIVVRVSQQLEHVALVHVSDWREGGPRRLNDRLVPGRGVIPFVPWGEMLARSGYAGWICLEMLSDPGLEDSYLHEPLAQVVEEGRETLRHAGLLDARAAGERVRPEDSDGRYSE